MTNTPIKNKIKKLLALGIACTATISLLPACSEKSVYYQDYYCMSAVATLVLTDVTADDFFAISKEVEEVLAAAERSLSVHISTSCISAFNGAEAGARVPLDATSYEVLRTAQTVYNLTDGAYNPAVYHSVRAYGFFNSGFRSPTFALPGAEEIAAYSALASAFSEIELIEENGGYYAQKPATAVTVGDTVFSVALDLGGIGKGWCVDRVNAILDEHGATHGYFNFGSSSLAFKSYGGSDSGEYSLLVRDPRGTGGASYASLSVKDCSLSTSGDYEQYYFVKDGKVSTKYEEGSVRYCHLIDPSTGAPVQTGIASVTVMGGSAAETDALTTALTVMGEERATQFIKTRLSDRKVIMLSVAGEDAHTGKVITNASGSVQIINSDYVLAKEE